jgi:AcrR family transcriptional regulator
MTSVPPKKESRREQKRQETLKRISEKGLKLFIANGYEGATLEAIAAAAGISRRTFFYYFKSKDEVLLASQGGGFIEALRPSLLDESPDQAPFVAVRNCLSKLVSRYETKESIILDQLLQSTEALRARKQAIFVQMEGIRSSFQGEKRPLDCLISIAKQSLSVGLRPSGNLENRVSAPIAERASIAVAPRTGEF